jgi:hypothetical protein
MSLSVKQRELVQKFDEEALYWLDGITGVINTSGVGGSLVSLRRGREPNRPVTVTLEPTRAGRLWLGLTVSRPRNGKFVYDTVLGRWDLATPIRRGGPLNENKPRHRRVAVWGLQLLRAMINASEQIKAGADPVTSLVVPRVFIPFAVGSERVDSAKLAAHPDAVIDSQRVTGKTLVDAIVARDADVSRAIDDDSALEDFSPVLGQKVPNPFRLTSAVRDEKDNPIPVSKIQTTADSEIMAAARRFLGRGLSGGATDIDIITAAQNVGDDMTLSLFSRVQLVSTEALSNLPDPYAGSAIPPINWQITKKAPVLI